MVSGQLNHVILSIVTFPLLLGCQAKVAPTDLKSEIGSTLPREATMFWVMTRDCVSMEQNLNFDTLCPGLINRGPIERFLVIRKAELVQKDADLRAAATTESVDRLKAAAENLGKLRSLEALHDRVAATGIACPDLPPAGDDIRERIDEAQAATERAADDIEPIKQ